MVLCCCNRAVPQNALDHRIVNPKAIQVRSQSSAETVPTMPEYPGTSEYIFHFPLIARIQVKWVPRRVCKDRPSRRIPALETMRIKPLG
jgi:hypothetical protein